MDLCLTQYKVHPGSEHIPGSVNFTHFRIWYIFDEQEYAAGSVHV